VVKYGTYLTEKIRVIDEAWIIVAFLPLNPLKGTYLTIVAGANSCNGISHGWSLLQPSYDGFL
jgi:hypothetical protein